MIHWKLAFHSLTHHQRENGLFILASSVLIAINYIFWSLLNNHSLRVSPNGSIIEDIVSLGLVFVVMIAVIFTFYANSFIMRQRNRELGLFNMLGLTRRDLRVILLFENGCLFVISSVIGLIMGVTFIKLAFLMLKKLLADDRLIDRFSVGTVMIVGTIFGLTYMALLLYDFAKLRQVKPIDLWRQAEKGEREPKSRWLSGALGMILLVAGYWLASTTKPTADSIIRFMLAVGLVVIGVYLIFIAVSIILLKFLRAKANFYYQPNHFISVSGMLFRMKQNGAGLASICLLCTSILVTMIATISLFVGEQQLIKLWNPYDIMTVTTRPETQSVKSQTEKLATQHHVRIQTPGHYRMTLPQYGQLTTNRFKKVNVGKTTHQLSTITVADYNRIQGTHQKLKSNQVLVYTPNGRYQGKRIILNHHRYQARPLSDFKMAVNYEHTIFQMVFVVAANQRVARRINPQPWLFVNGFNLAGSLKNRNAFATAMQQQFHLKNAEFSVKTFQQSTFKSIFGGFLFVGILISLTMSFATALIIYYKQVSEGMADAKRFETMQQVGLSRSESRRAIHSQVLMVFMLPILGAVINLGFAFPAVRSLLTLFSMYSFGIFIGVSIGTTVFLTACYLLVYWLTTRVYQRLVGAES